MADYFVQPPFNHIAHIVVLVPLNLFLFKVEIKINHYKFEHPHCFLTHYTIPSNVRNSIVYSAIYWLLYVDTSLKRPY